MRTAKQILEEVEAGEKLRERGWRQVECNVCHGKGYLELSPDSQYCRATCYECGGVKTIWTAPMIEVLINTVDT